MMEELATSSTVVGGEAGDSNLSEMLEGPSNMPFVELRSGDPGLRGPSIMFDGAADASALVVVTGLECCGKGDTLVVMSRQSGAGCTTSTHCF